jgi:amino acid adenylation domain-containing protein
VSDLVPSDLSVKKQALLELLLKKQSKGFDAFPLSFAQERLWFLDQWDPHSSLYTIFLALRLTGQLLPAALAQSITTIVQRHETLRTTFHASAGQAVQVIAPAQPCHLPLSDLTALPQEERAEVAHALARTEARRPFDLSQGPLLRVSLLRLGARDHALLLTLHHIVADGWSMGILLAELAALYRAACAGQPSPLPVLPIQYADYALWQRQWLQGALRERQLAYWKAQLAGAPTVLELPTDRPRSPRQSARGAHLNFLVPAGLAQQLKALGRQQEATLFMTLLATLQVLLLRYSGQEDLLIGTPIANRSRPEVEPLIGFFVNMLVLRTSLAGAPGFRQLLRRTRQTCLEAYAHQDLPFEQLVEALQLPRSLQQTPLFQVVFQLQNTPGRSVELPGLTLASFKTAPALAKFDLNITLSESEQGLAGVVEYSADLFAGHTIARLLGHWLTLLASIVADPDRSIERLPLLTPQQRQQVLVTWNNTRRQNDLSRCVHLLFEARVQESPERIAQVFQEEHLSYHELNRRANQLAWCLRAQGVGTERLVAVLGARDSALLSAILAVFKAGGAYCALDPRDPPARLRQQLAGCFCVLTNACYAPLVREIASAWPPGHGPRILYREALACQEQATTNLPDHSRLSQLAYVMYTSGSTGQPKGAQLEQRGMLNHLSTKIQELALTARDRVAHTAWQCFDISVWQFLAPLLVGGLVLLFEDEVLRDPTGHLAAFARAGVTVFESAPSLLAAMLSALEHGEAECPPLPAVHGHVCSGEALPPDLCRRWLACYPHIPIINAYGATECSDDVTLARIRQAPAGARTPVGRPAGNLQRYVLDRHLEAVPVGVTGEIYLGGAGVGRGYLGDAWRTARAFLADPFSQEAGARLYRTGDLGRLLPDGTLDFLGRRDQQVKVRGLRIELEEIEGALRQHPLVREAVVLARQDAGQETHLVAYLVGTSTRAPTAGEVRDFLKTRLPEYMLPTIVQTLDALPLNANGKIERRALPAPHALAAQTEAVAPRTPLEARLAALWCETLGLQRVGVFANFFEIGGHSLLATRLLARLRSAFGLNCPLRLIFEAPTISAQADALAHLLAAQVDGALLAALEDLVPDEEGGARI